MSDAIVIGSGIDALVAAQMLAARGRRVALIQESAPSQPVMGYVPGVVTRALGLGALSLQTPDPWLRALLPDGGVLELWHDMRRSVEALRRVSPRDAERWPAFCERMARLAAFLERLYVEPPPGLVDMRFALKIRGLGRQAMEDLMRLLPMPAAELLDDWFECDALKGALGALAVRDLQQGPRSGGTAFGLLHSHVGAPTGVFRPPITNYMERVRLHGGIQRLQAKVAGIRVREGRAAGVALEGGEELDAWLVVSAADPRRTLAELVEPGWLDPELLTALRNLRCRGVRAVIRWQLERAPDWRCATVAPTLDHVEQACDDAKYGRISARPVVDVVAEGAGATANFQYAPYRLRDGEWSETQRAGVAAAAEKALDRLLPAVRARTVLAPPDLETSEGWPEGQPHHAELALDQALWMRPLPELARYRTPIAGLWLCGPAMHPGAGIPGAAGYNCAREILRS